MAVINRQPLDNSSTNGRFGLSAYCALVVLGFKKFLVFSRLKSVLPAKSGSALVSLSFRSELGICSPLQVAFFLAFAISLAGALGAMPISISASCCVGVAFVAFFAVWLWMRNIVLLPKFASPRAHFIAMFLSIVAMPFVRALFASTVRKFANLSNKVFATATVVRVRSIFTRAKSCDYFARSIVRFWMDCKPFLVAAKAPASIASANLCQYVFLVPAQLRIASNSSFPHALSVATFTRFVNNILSASIDTLSYFLVAQLMMVEDCGLQGQYL